MFIINNNMIKSFEEFGVKFAVCKCNLCSYVWFARKEPENIIECPHCKRKIWNKEKSNN